MRKVWDDLSEVNKIKAESTTWQDGKGKCRPDNAAKFMMLMEWVAIRIVKNGFGLNVINFVWETGGEEEASNFLDEVVKNNSGKAPLMHANYKRHFLSSVDYSKRAERFADSDIFDLCNNHMQFSAQVRNFYIIASFGIYIIVISNSLGKTSPETCSDHWRRTFRY